VSKPTAELAPVSQPFRHRRAETAIAAECPGFIDRGDFIVSAANFLVGLIM
jgi:hypothetical protein